MNIFVVDGDPKVAAIMLVDKHVVKMILESCQMLCTAHHICGGPEKPEYFYKKTHVNHPCNKWIRESLSNYNWLCKHNLALCEEYTYRYVKTHKAQKQGLVDWLEKNKPNIVDIGLTKFVEATGQHKGVNPIESYRKYYIGEKVNLFKWTKRESPEWIKG